ncbi:MAG: hypothetical protein M1827_006960 [Pycnora praestabilis]|nr:MAG: hypothetical protein M1827_006960 [Pycnora praestabilis]
MGDQNSAGGAAASLLIAHGINPNQLTAFQFNTFKIQPPHVRQASIDLYAQNLAAHHRAAHRSRGYITPPYNEISSNEPTDEGSCMEPQDRRLESDHNSRRDGKGKKRVKDLKQETPHTEGEWSPSNGASSGSMTSRISASASGLAQGLLGKASANEIPSALSSALANTEKTPAASRSSGESSTWAAHAQGLNQALSSSSSQDSRVGEFRSNADDAAIDWEFEDFLKGGSQYPQAQTQLGTELLKQGSTARQNLDTADLKHTWINEYDGGFSSSNKQRVTPSMIDFHRTAMSAAATRKNPTNTFGQHESNDAALGLFSLPQNRNEPQHNKASAVLNQLSAGAYGLPKIAVQASNQMSNRSQETSPNMQTRAARDVTGPDGCSISGSIGGVSETIDDFSDFGTSEHAKPNIRGAFTKEDDGSEVVVLLSDPEWSPEELPSSSFAVELQEEMIEQEFFASTLSPVELEVAKQLRAKLPPPPMHQAPLANYPKNLLPSYEHVPIPNISGNSSKLLLTTTLPNTDESYMYYSSADERERWLSDWDEVLNRYTDEVWGDLFPIVRQARVEVDEVRNHGVVPEGKTAIRRLGMILGHVKSKDVDSAANVSKK